MNLHHLILEALEGNSCATFKELFALTRLYNRVKNIKKLQGAINTLMRNKVIKQIHKPGAGMVYVKTKIYIQPELFPNDGKH